MVELTPLGDRAILARFQDEATAAGWAAAVRARGLRGVVDVVAAYRTAAVFADTEQVELPMLARELEAVQAEDASQETGRLHTIPVLYDGPDLEDVSRARGLDPGAVIVEHTRAEYRVFAVGFQPGFPYAGYLPPALEGLPRRSSPRTAVPAGSVAIVGRQTGIYPASSPGGWHLIGRTPLTLVDLEAAYFPIQAGDRIRFVAIDRGEFDDQRGGRL